MGVGMVNTKGFSVGGIRGSLGTDIGKGISLEAYVQWNFEDIH